MTNIIQFTNVGTGLHIYAPEMGQHKPAANMEARLSHDGKHYYIDTLLALKPARGLKLVKTYTESDFIKPGYYKIGWFEYIATEKAFERLQSEYSISMESLLD